MLPLNHTQENREDYGMTYTHEPQPLLEKADGAVERLVQHLRRWPCDVIDVRHLMFRFQASVSDFQQALARLGEAALYSARKGAGTS
jgi:hypothetical protein